MREITPPEAAKLLAGNPDAVFIDVRSREEFAAGHPAGAINVPVAEPNEWGQMQPNRDFVQVVQALVPDPAATVLFSCKAGGRSQYACELMESTGYTGTVNVDGGFHGRPSPYGQIEVAGWLASNLPCSRDNGDGVSWDSIKKRTLGEA